MAAGELPHGTAGVCHFEEMCRGVRSFAVSAGPYLQSRRPLPMELDLEIGDFHLKEGSIPSTKGASSITGMQTSGRRIICG